MEYQEYYLSYSGVGLPLKMVGQLEKKELNNRNTFFGVCLDEVGRIHRVQKIVYGEVELDHLYGYSDKGKLIMAEVTGQDGKLIKLSFG